ncbi:unnamed protein product [Boreogadus saida]
MSLGPPQVGAWREGADGAAIHGRTRSPTFWGLGGPNQDSVFLLLRASSVLSALCQSLFPLSSCSRFLL